MTAFLHMEELLIVLLVIFATALSECIKQLHKCVYNRRNGEGAFSTKKYEYLYAWLSIVLGAGFAFLYERFYLQTASIEYIIDIAWKAGAGTGTAYTIIVQVSRKGITFVLGKLPALAEWIASLKSKTGAATVQQSLENLAVVASSGANEADELSISETAQAEAYTKASEQLNKISDKITPEKLRSYIETLKKIG